MASFAFCCMATPRVAESIRELDSKTTTTTTSLLNRMLQWSRKRCWCCCCCQLVPSCNSWSMSLICSKMSMQNSQLELICPSNGNPLLLLLLLTNLSSPPRSMLIYAHIFVDNSRDLIAHRAAANCYLVRQLICQKIDLARSLEAHLEPA